jgi:hypothetical protein
MAQQESLLKLNGQIDGMTLYKTRNGYQARKKSGVDGKRILTDPRFERTRENFAEFGRAGRAGKFLRTALRSQLVKVFPGKMHTRLTQAMMGVIRADKTSIRGQRNVIDGEVTLLTGFEFNDTATLKVSLSVPFTSTLDRATGIAVVNVPAFEPKPQVVEVQGATHFKLVAIAAEVDFEAETSVVTEQSSSELPWNRTTTAPLVITTPPVTPGSAHPILLLLGIEYFQELNGNFYEVGRGMGNALSIINVDDGL